MTDEYYEMCERYGLTPGDDQADIMWEIESYQDNEMYYDNECDDDYEEDYEDDEYERCPKCGGILRIKYGRFGPFIGCENFRRLHCKHSRSV